MTQDGPARVWGAHVRPHNDLSEPVTKNDVRAMHVNAGSTAQTSTWARLQDDKESNML